MNDITCKQLGVNICNRCEKYNNNLRCWVPIYKDQLSYYTHIKTCIAVAVKQNKEGFWPENSFYHMRIAIELYYPHFLEEFDKLSVLL